MQDFFPSQTRELDRREHGCSIFFSLHHFLSHMYMMSFNYNYHINFVISPVYFKRIRHTGGGYV